MSTHAQARGHRKSALRNFLPFYLFWENYINGLLAKGFQHLAVILYMSGNLWLCEYFESNFGVKYWTFFSLLIWGAGTVAGVFDKTL